jgi:hypothetical protein
MRELREGVSYRNFSSIAEIMHWTVDELAAEFKGDLENATNFFTRVLREEPSGDVVIPFKSVIAKYLGAARHLIADGKIRICTCGCCSPVFGRDRLAWPDCKFKVMRGQDGHEGDPFTVI